MGGGRHNNFDALRLVAAASVVFSHSFLISEGTQDHEWLIWLTENQSILGLVGVFVFFAISGFLVTQSFEETGDAWRFLAKRSLRIFPGLFVATVLSAFALAPLVTTLWPSAFLSRPEPYEYVIGNTLLDQTVHELPGVMFVNNPVGLEINGSLWTLRLEFTMYLMVLALGVLRLLTVRAALLLLAFGMACLHFNMLDELEKWGWFFQLLSGWGWLRPQRAVAPVHPSFPAVRLLPRSVARPDPAPAGHPGGALRRSVLRHLHLWLAGRAGGRLAVRRPGGMVAGVPARVAGGGNARLPVLASGRAPGPSPETGRAAFLGGSASRRWRRGQPRRYYGLARTNLREGGNADTQPLH